MVNLTKYNKKGSGFTIVELLVVIVVIGILAAITIVSYSTVTARANSASAQAAASNVINKANVFFADGPTNSWPTTFTQLTNAAATTTYYLPGTNFTNASNAPNENATMTATLNDATHMNITPTSTVDFELCGTGAAGAAPGSYSGITIPTGLRVDFWDFVNKQVSVNPPAQTAGTINGTGNVACYKVGLPETAMATARAYFNDNGAWPNATQLNTFNGTGGGTAAAKLPSYLTVISALPIAGNINSTTVNSTVAYNCKGAVAGVCTTGGRIGFYNTITTAIEYIYFGGAISTDPFTTGA
jgi:prepilin-type N-terminal cleavage/methylation domain-containing protein